MGFKYDYFPSLPGTRETGLPPARPLPPHVGSINADQVAQLMAEKEAAIKINTRAAEKAYVRHQHILKRFDRLIRSVERVADTPELDRLLLGLRVQRETAERLLFTGYARDDTMTMNVKINPEEGR